MHIECACACNICWMYNQDNNRPAVHCCFTHWFTSTPGRFCHIWYFFHVLLSGKYHIWQTSPRCSVKIINTQLSNVNMQRFETWLWPAPQRLKTWLELKLRDLRLDLKLGEKSLEHNTHTHRHCLSLSLSLLDTLQSFCSPWLKPIWLFFFHW